MRLPVCIPPSDPRTRLEMISWLTPAGARLEESDVFQVESERFERGAEILANLADPGSGFIRPEDIADVTLALPVDQRQDQFESVAIACLWLTGQSDNALKCQFPVYLLGQNFAEAKALLGLAPPSITQPVLKVLKFKDISKVVGRTTSAISAVRETIIAYFDFLFTAANSSRFETAVKAIRAAEPAARKSLLETITITAVRGSATASGGHEPEDALRLEMERWGLQRGHDFNTSDVSAMKLYEICGSMPSRSIEAKAKKSRAFDFVVPFAVPGLMPRLLVQGQFYAGDSGSVSHKNVDQTPTGRAAARDVVPDPVFAEFLDGAGYVTALANDARNLLAMVDTEGLIQLRTAPIRLRELLQRINLATPLEIAHAIWSSESCSEPEVQTKLEERYGAEEAARALERALATGFATRKPGGSLSVGEGFIEDALEYAVIDSIARSHLGQDPADPRPGLTVPGYGCEHSGVSEDAVLEHLEANLPSLSSPQVAGKESAIENALEAAIRRGVAKRVE